ncbi:hypothetical protein ANAEL_01544 [Anaerolineales bacterium]|nr:hypothetical protein ANAEL_01544 [Anaerolineales bacterium]
MNIPSILGTIGTVLGLVRAVPQLARLLRAREAFGVSVDTTGTSTIVSISWVVYGILTNQPYVCLSTAPTAIIFGIITFIALRFGRSTREFKVAPVWGMVLLLAGLLGGIAGLGLILSISVLISNLPQLWVAYREGNLDDLSLGTWVLCTCDGLVWGSYALFMHDTSILFYGLFQFATSAAIVTLKLAHRSKGPAEKSF